MNSIQENVLHHYYSEHESSTSPDSVVPWIIDRINPKSVIDVGCGLGQWLEAFKKYNPDIDILGLDGAHVPQNRLRIALNKFMPVDLSKPENILLPEIKKFELAVSLEVAEHLHEDKADPFVNFLTSTSDVILFSAAIPGQTGENHFNEQWPDYWIKKFESKGYTVNDEIRWTIWNNHGVSWWYKQNILLFTRTSSSKSLTTHSSAKSVVHPECFEYINKILNETISQNKALSQEIAKIKSLQHGNSLFAKINKLFNSK